METKVISLANGLRIIYKHVPYTRAVHCGFMVDNGSRDDQDGEMGMAHFIEHMIFKGTSKRKTFHIVNYLESVGGDLNAYTTKEKTCLYASLVAKYLDRATELLADIVFNSTFPEKEIIKEKQVISEEIDMYRNAPDEAILEDFDSLIFPEHGLGHPILGTKHSIQTITQERVKQHIQRSFTQGRIVYGIVGNVTQQEVDKVVDKYLRDLVLPQYTLVREKPEKLPIPHQETGIEYQQAHEILGGRAYALRQGHYTPFMLLHNLLGGPAMNSRLNLNIREKYGLTYNIGSFYNPYMDSGLWGIYYACEQKNLERVRKMVERELKELVAKPLGVIRLSQAKKQLIGQLTLGHENLLQQMRTMAEDLLDFNDIPSFSEFIKEIEIVSAKDIQEAAEEIFRQQTITRVSYKHVG